MASVQNKSALKIQKIYKGYKIRVSINKVQQEFLNIFRDVESDLQSNSNLYNIYSK